jgi:DNA-directed RNA polymerase specialized sigma24 family protein
VQSWKQTLAELASDRLTPLKRHAFLLGGDESQAEDLVQDALVRAFGRPLRAPRPGAAEAYVRVIMTHLFIDGTRRRSRWHRVAPLLQGAELGVAEGTVRRYLSEAMTRLAVRLSPAASGERGRDETDGV